MNHHKDLRIFTWDSPEVIEEKDNLGKSYDEYRQDIHTMS